MSQPKIYVNGNIRLALLYVTNNIATVQNQETGETFTMSVVELMSAYNEAEEEAFSPVQVMSTMFRRGDEYRWPVSCVLTEAGLVVEIEAGVPLAYPPSDWEPVSV